MTCYVWITTLRHNQNHGHNNENIENYYNLNLWMHFKIFLILSTNLRKVNKGFYYSSLAKGAENNSN